jgi:hypothetical protein
MKTFLTALFFVCINLYAQTSKQIFEDDAIIVKGNNKPVTLFDNPGAKNPTYDQLLSFLKADQTDKITYLGRESGNNSFLCADFAELLHNNAEEAGLRCAWVGIRFKRTIEGHALNLFNTRDKGDVYVDCTGNNENYIHFRDNETNVHTYDKIAYVKKNSVLGLISIDFAKVPAYYYYPQYSRKLNKQQKLVEKFNKITERYNRDTEGKTFYIGTKEHERIVKREDEIESMLNQIEQSYLEIGNFYIQPMGKVKDIQIHW